MLGLFSKSIVRQIVAITLALLLLSTAAIAYATYQGLSSYVMRSAVSDAKNAGRAMAVLYGAAFADAHVAVTDNRLSGVTQDVSPAFGDHTLVDRVAQSIGGVATIFEKRGQDFVRVSTNLKKENGERAVGTNLAADHPAQALLAQGQAYYGPAELFGHKFMTGYFPIKNATGASVGILFIGIPMEVYYANLHALLSLVMAIGAGVMLVAGLLAFFAIRASVRPLEILTGTVGRISGGDLTAEVPYAAKANEFGAIARALSIFRDNAVAKQRVEAEAADERMSADRDRARNDEEKRSLDRQIDAVVVELAAGLGRLAKGDVSQTIDVPFIGRLEQLRIDFNASLARLQDTLSHIRENAGSIHGTGNTMRQSVAELSKRTESQAASLEETAAAVDEITTAVRSSAERARDANKAVSAMKQTADSSATVVGNAIEAMTRIEGTSRKIEQIIEVIDDIAFQTNLLALNAGIEAARAGEAGKGFAVVAQEVRELAQRSAGAAKEIQDLINRSSHEVAAGVSLVQETGGALASIGRDIAAVSAHVEVIATASREQSTALQEVNGSVNRMDQMTQQNAAMAEEAAAASHELATEAETLLSLVQQFRIDAGLGSARRQAA